MSEHDVIIVGAGPAGASAAIQLAASAPELIGRTLLLDRATFPRDKLCGGGVVREADRLLSFLDVEIQVPSVAIDTIAFEHAGGSVVSRRPAAFRVVHRAEFDAALLDEARARGVAVRHGEHVIGLARLDRGVRVITTAGEYVARTVIGADGAASIVRRSAVGGRPPRRFVALEVFTDDSRALPSARNTAVFDFRPTAQGLHGYYWDFPSLQAGRRVMNRGIGGTRWPRPHGLDDVFEEQLHRRGLGITAGMLQGAPIPLYDPSLPQSAERVVLAGDAVGVDPWLGEGISVAIGTGMLAAHAVVDAFARDDFSFRHHRERIAGSAVGVQLRRNRAIARRFYRDAVNTNGLHRWFEEVAA